MEILWLGIRVSTPPEDPLTAPVVTKGAKGERVVIRHQNAPQPTESDRVEGFGQVQVRNAKQTKPVIK